jgi:hypothetical protein
VNLDDLRGYLTEPRNDEKARPTVFIARNAPVQPVLDWLTERFAKTDDLTVVTVRIGDDDPGILTRDAVLDLQRPVSKGVPGYGDHFQLPGVSPLTGLRLQCPVDGAKFTRYIYDEASPPTCKVHKGIVLELEK